MGVVTGTFQTPAGSPIASGLFQWKLNQDAILLSTAAICPVIISGYLDGSGNMTATFAFNDVITTAGGTNTTYQLTIKDAFGGQVWNENYYLTGAAANVNLVGPGTIFGGPFFYPVIAGGSGGAFSQVFVNYASSMTFPGPATGFSTILTGNVSSSTVTGLTAGQIIAFEIVQDGVGGHTFAWPANFKGASTLSGAAIFANATFTQIFYYDGTNCVAVGPGVVN